MADNRFGPATRDSRRRSVSSIAAIWVPLAGLYGVFAGSVGVTEGLAGVVCASLGTLWARRVGRGGAAFRPRAEMLRPLARAAAGLPGRTLRVGLDLIRAFGGAAVTGAIQVRPLASVSRHAPSDDSAEAWAGRAIGVLGASLAPDSYVLRLDRAPAEIVLHAFGAGKTRANPS